MFTQLQSGRAGPVVAVGAAGFGPPATATLKLPFEDDYPATRGWNEKWDK